MKKKKITIVMSYDYEDKNVFVNDKIAEKIKRDLMKGINPAYEKIESVLVENMKQ